MRFVSLPAFLLLMLAAGAAAAPAAAAPPPAAQGQEPPVPRIRVRVPLVTLYATVRGHHNALVANLTEKNFQVYEDGKEQKIAYFSKESKLPLTMGILVDTSGSQQGLLDAEKTSAERFLQRVLRPKDEAMVITFDLDVNLLADFTNDAGILDRAIERAEINAPQGSPYTPGPFPQKGPIGTDFYDAVYLACHDKLSGEAGRKALIILTDAQDYGSKMKLSDAIEEAQRTDTVVHILLINNLRAYGWGGMGGGYNGGSVAEKMTQETGGRLIEVHSEKKLQEAFDQISEELRNQYVIGYYPSNTKLDGTFRKVKVETVPEHDKVLTRKGYYAPTQ
jgi:VWFA-related protein